MKRPALIFLSLAVLVLQNCTCSRKFDDSGFMYMEEEYAMAKKNFNAGNWDQAVGWYNKLQADYPDNPYNGEAAFIKGYIFKEYKKDKETAKKYFEHVIQQYPGSDFASSAKFELEHIDDPDFVPEFEK